MTAFATDALAPEVAHVRTPEYPVLPMFINRWSPRAMSGEPLLERDLLTLLEAARWAPSSYNDQPWRMIYARRDTPHWPRLFDLLVPGNQAWCVNAAALVVFTSRTTFEKNGKPNPCAVFDTGSAWMSLALQGSMMGLVVHGMTGFDRDRARRDLAVPEGVEIPAMCAVGKPGRREALSPDLQKREAPSGRKPLKEIALEGKFGG